METSTTTTLPSLAVVKPQAFNLTELLFDAPRMQQVWKLADVMSKATVTVPKHLHDKPGDCLAVVLQALRWGMDPFVVASKTYFVGGVIGYESQLVNAVLQHSGEVASRPFYEFKGDGQNAECRAGFIPAGEREIVWTEWAKAADQKPQNSPLWKTNPKQQLGYVQVRNWARLYAPGALLGVTAADDLMDSPLRDMGPADEVEEPRRRSATREAQASSGFTDAEPTGEVDPPPPPPPPPPVGEGALQWPDESFAGQLPRWTKAIQEGLKTVDEVIESALTKGTLSAEQLAKLRALAPVQRQDPAGVITATQLTYLRKKLDGAPISELSLLQQYKVSSLEQLTALQFDEIKARLLAL